MAPVTRAPIRAPLPASIQSATQSDRAQHFFRDVRPLAAIPNKRFKIKKFPSVWSLTASNKVISNWCVNLMPPVAFNPIPPSTSVDPVTRNPFRIMVRIVNVVARNPNITASVPPPVPRIPNMIVARSWWRGLNPYWRRSNPDNNFICRRLGRQAQHTADNYYPGKSTDRASNPMITHTRINPKRGIKLRERQKFEYPSVSFSRV
jgi:hypothetical protein